MDVQDIEKKANNPTELLDLVNEDDEVIGSVVRSSANKNPAYIHREAGVILINEKKELLFQQRSKFKTVGPNLWTISCAGHVEFGHNPEVVAHNELREELGFDTPLAFIAKELQHLENETRFLYYFIGNYDNQKIIVDEHEVARTKFFSQSALQQWIKDGNEVFTKHMDLCNEIWSGKYTDLLESLKNKDT